MLRRLVLFTCAPASRPRLLPRPPRLQSVADLARCHCSAICNMDTGDQSILNIDISDMAKKTS